MNPEFAGLVIDERYNPYRAWSSRRSGYSVSTSGTTSVTWTGRHSIAARPPTEVRRSGSTC